MPVVSPDCSVVVPLKDERESLPELVDRISSTLRRADRTFEVILVDDGSTDGSWETLLELCARDDALCAIRMRRNFGKATALAVGFSTATGRTVVTMDADLQDDPDELPRFLREIDNGVQVVSGWKRERHDPLSKRLPSRVFNSIVRRTSGLDLHDVNCGFKAYSHGAVTAVLPYCYGEMHRFMPVLAAAQGYRVGEIEVRHHPRRNGRSKYGARRMIAGACDLATVVLLTRFRDRPLHAFAAAGAAAGAVAVAGAAGGAVVGARRFALASLLSGAVVVPGLVASGLTAELLVHGFGTGDPKARTMDAVRVLADVAATAGVEADAMTPPPDDVVQPRTGRFDRIMAVAVEHVA